MKLASSTFLFIVSLASALAQSNEWPRRRFELRDDPASYNSCPNYYTPIDQKLYSNFKDGLNDAIKQHPVPLRKREAPVHRSRAPSAKLTRGNYRPNRDFISAYHSDRLGNRDYYMDDDRDYDLRERFLPETDGTFEDVVKQGCLWIVKHELNRAKDQAIRSAKRHFKDYLNRVMEQVGEKAWEDYLKKYTGKAKDVAWESVSSATMMFWKRYRTPRGDGGGKRDNGKDTEDLGFAINMEVQFRDGIPPPGAPPPQVVKILNIVGNDGVTLKESHVEGYWPLPENNWLGAPPHPRRDVSPRDDEWDNQCHFLTWAAFRTQINVLYLTVVIPMFLQGDDDLTSIEYDLFSPGRRAIFKGIAGGVVRVKFWISPAPTLSDTAAAKQGSFEPAPNCLNSPADLQNALKYQECYLPTDRTLGVPPPTPEFWGQASNACKQAFHGTIANEKHGRLYDPPDPPKDFHFYDNQGPGNWRVEYFTDNCITKFLCSDLFGLSGDGKGGTVADHWNECTRKDKGGDGQSYYGGWVYPNTGGTDHQTGDLELKRQTPALDAVLWSPCGVLRIFPKEAGEQYWPS